MEWRGRLLSRKFWLAIIAAVLPVLNETFAWEIPTEALLVVLAPVLAYIFGESYIDGQRAAANVSLTRTPGLDEADPQ